MQQPRTLDHLALITRTGGAMSLRALRRAGMHETDLRVAVRSGELRRVRAGWVALAATPPEVVRAVRVGGALTAGSIAELSGVWTLDDGLLHVRVPRTASRLRSPDDARVPLDRRDHGVCVHYREGPLGRTVRDDLVTAIAEMFRCAGTIPAMIALDSALNLGALQMGHVESLRALVPGWAQRAIDDATPESDSGLETIARLLMRRLRVRVRVQAAIPGVRRVDLLVGDRLVLELDGRRFHSGDDFDRDRRHDLELALRGYLVVRISYRMVIDEWDDTQRALQALLARGLHRWGGTARPMPAHSPAGIQAPSPLTWVDGA